MMPIFNIHSKEEPVKIEPTHDPQKVGASIVRRDEPDDED